MKINKIFYSKILILMIIHFFIIDVLSMNEKLIEYQRLLEKFESNILQYYLILDDFYRLKDNKKKKITKKHCIKIWKKLSIEDYECMPRCIVSSLFGTNQSILKHGISAISKLKMKRNIQKIPAESLGILEIINIQTRLEDDDENVVLTEHQIKNLPEDTLYQLYKKNDQRLKSYFSQYHIKLISDKYKKQRNGIDSKTEAEYELLSYTGSYFNTITKDILKYTTFNNISKALPYISKEIIQALSASEIKSIQITSLLKILNKLLPEQFTYIEENKLKQLSIKDISHLISYQYHKHLTDKALINIQGIIKKHFNKRYDIYHYTYEEGFLLLSMLEKYKHSIEEKESTLKNDQIIECLNNINSTKNIINNSYYIDSFNESLLLKNKTDIKTLFPNLLNVVIKEIIEQQNKNPRDHLDKNIKTILQILLMNHIKETNFNNFIKKCKKLFTIIKIIITELKNRNTEITFNLIDKKILESNWIDCNLIIKNNEEEELEELEEKNNIKDIVNTIDLKENISISEYSNYEQDASHFTKPIYFFEVNIICKDYPLDSTSINIENDNNDTIYI